MILTQEALRSAETRGWHTPSPDSRTDMGSASLVPPRRATLRKVLAGTGLETRYQPMVDMDSRRTVSMEALVRLNVSRHVTLFPADFLPQVEAAGLSAALTDAVTTRALDDWALLSPAGRPVLSINFSLDVLLSVAALERLEQRLHESGLAASDILIELTESRPVDDLLRLRATVEQLRTAGYRIALDDITPSVPHLDSLIDMPFTDLKLDKAVVHAAPHWPDAVRFIERMVARARARDLTVTAEGLEDDASWHMMRGLGIHCAQGFLIGQPMPAADVPGWLTEWPRRRAA